jgi:hypothetical protein
MSHDAVLVGATLVPALLFGLLLGWMLFAGDLPAPISPAPHTVPDTSDATGLGGKPRGGGPRIRHAHVVGDRVLSAPGSVTDCRLCAGMSETEYAVIGGLVGVAFMLGLAFLLWYRPVSEREPSTRRCGCKSALLVRKGALTSAEALRLRNLKPGDIFEVDNLDDICAVVWHTCGK